MLQIANRRRRQSAAARASSTAKYFRGPRAPGAPVRKDAKKKRRPPGAYAGDSEHFPATAEAGADDKVGDDCALPLAVAVAADSAAADAPCFVEDDSDQARASRAGASRADASREPAPDGSEARMVHPQL